MTVGSHPRARTVALIGHAGVGKTTLLEALVVATGGLSRAGSVAEGTTLVGTDPEERKHGTSLQIGFAPIFVGADKLTLLDTPGVADFHGEVERALEVADVAVLVVSAVDGVEVDTEATWHLAQNAEVPVIVFMNGLDHERADFEGTLAQLEALVGPALAPLELPIMAGPGFSGVVDLLADQAITDGPDGPTTGPVPDQLAELERRVRASLVEAAVMVSDDLTERYLEGEPLAIEELEAAVSAELGEGSMVPVTCGSALTGVGVARLATLLDEIADSRTLHGTLNGAPATFERDPEALPIARAFKTIIDPFVGRITVLEVVSGTLTPDLSLTNGRTKSEERLRGLSLLMGSELRPVDRAYAGDVVAVTKLADTQVGDTLAPKGSEVTIDLPEPPPSALTVAVRPAAPGDDDKLLAALYRLAEEDPSLVVRQVAETRQVLLETMGDTHVAVVLERVQRRFNVAAVVEPPEVARRETVARAVEVEGKLKKQTGGHGQFAQVHLKVEPLPRGAGFEFVDAVVGGAVPRQYIGAVRHGVEKQMAHGGPAGYPVVDLRVTLDDGKAHSVDSSDAAFEQAGALALREALELSGTVLLEPIAEIAVTVPAELLGDVLSDLGGRRARVTGTDQGGDAMATVSAEVPAVALARFGVELRAMTRGRARAVVLGEHLAEVTEPSPRR